MKDFIRKFSFYNICDLFYIPLCFLVFRVSCLKTKPKFFLLFLVLYLFFFLFQFNRKSKVFNNSDSVIWAKPETGSKIFTIQPNESCSDVDGVNMNGFVYKIPDGLPVEFRNDGIHHFSFTGFILFKLFGRRFDGWNELFCK